MRFLAAVVFGAGILVVVCNAACFRSRNVMTQGKEPKGCYFRKNMHPLNSQWRTKDCMDCSCFSDGNYKCCYAYGKPVNYDKENCNLVFDSTACAYKLIPNEDPNIECEIYGMVG